jgi:hypothetical protein
MSRKVFKINGQQVATFQNVWVKSKKKIKIKCTTTLLICGGNNALNVLLVFDLRKESLHMGKLTHVLHIGPHFSTSNN